MRDRVPKPCSRVWRFNLVELVVVLTVLVSLLCLILPAIARASLRGKSLLCSRNQGRLGIWVNMYCANNKGVLPAYEDGWVSMIGAMGQKTVDAGTPPVDEFACPGQPYVSLSPETGPGAWWQGTNYGLNQHIASNYRDMSGKRITLWGQADLNKIPDPSVKVVIADAGGSDFQGTRGLAPTIAGISRDGVTHADGLPPKPARPFPYLRHVDGVGNFLFIDGHVDGKKTWPVFMTGPGTSGRDFWHAEHME